jgi:hypothetical protein
VVMWEARAGDSNNRKTFEGLLNGFDGPVAALAHKPVDSSPSVSGGGIDGALSYVDVSYRIEGKPVALVRTLPQTSSPPRIRMTDHLASTFIEFLANRPSPVGTTSRQGFGAQGEADVRAAEPRYFNALIGDSRQESPGIETNGCIAFISTVGNDQFVCVYDASMMVEPSIVRQRISDLRR